MTQMKHLTREELEQQLANERAKNIQHMKRWECVK
jgi:hypothetical protein